MASFPRRAATVLALAGLMLSAGASAMPKLDGKLLKMTPQDFHGATIVHDDPLEPAAIITTEDAYQSGRRAAFRTVWHDSHLRAKIDRKTGAARYEVHQYVRYWGPRRDYASVNYQAAGNELREARLTLAKHDVDHCPNSDSSGECSLSKRLAFEVDEATLRQVAASYASGAAQPWAFKFKDRTGSEDLRAAITPAEAAGFLSAVDAYRQRAGAAGSL